MRRIELTGIGADIEVFLKEKETDRIVSAEGHIKGSKYDPHRFDEENTYFSTSLDNVLAEFTIPPALSPEDFLNYINKGLGYINQTLPDHLCTIATPCANLEDEFLFTDNGMTFGCEPDFNAYTNNVNEKNPFVDYTLRTGGGHIHIGYKDPEKFDQQTYLGDPERSRIVKALDLFIGIPSVIMEPDNERKQLYGCAGSFRPKPYGVEYRTLSNYYLQDEKLTKWVYNSAKKAIDWLNSGQDIDNDISLLIQDTINTNNKEVANEIITSFQLELVD